MANEMKLEGVLQKFQRRLCRELTQIDDDRAQAIRAREDKIRALRRELHLSLQAMTLPLDAIDIPAITLRRLLDEEQRLLLMQPTVLAQRKFRNKVRSLRPNSAEVSNDEIIDESFIGSKIIGPFVNNSVSSAAAVQTITSSTESGRSTPLTKTFYILRNQQTNK